jgi:hypothetical protein
VVIVQQFERKLDLSCSKKVVAVRQSILRDDSQILINGRDDPAIDEDCTRCSRKY